MRPRVAVLPGDGIGPEVIEAAVDTVTPHAEVSFVPAGADRFLAKGELLTPDDMATIAGSDAVLFGAVGDSRVPDGVLERGILLRLRAELDLYVNVRPFPELDLVFVRENTEGLYAGTGALLDDTAIEVSLNTRAAVSRCIDYAFSLAASRSGRVTLVHKSNVLKHAGSMWKELFARSAGDNRHVMTFYQHVDAAAYHLVTDPDRFDVIVTDNMFGDILSDVAAGLAGGLGRAASANLHPDPSTRPTRCLGLFEPVHGSAPDIAGTGTADPTAAIRAAELLVAALEREPVS